MSAWKQAACERLRAAQGSQSDEAFADRLSEMVDWNVDPDLVYAWARGHGCPPGDLLLAAESVRAVGRRHLKVVS